MDLTARLDRRRTATLWLAVAGFWSFVALLYATQLLWLINSRGERINMRRRSPGRSPTTWSGFRSRC